MRSDRTRFGIQVTQFNKLKNSKSYKNKNNNKLGNCSTTRLRFLEKSFIG